MDGWTLQFEFAHKISTIKQAKIVGHHGGSYLIRNEKSDAKIAPGQSVTFRFNGRPGHASAGPTNIVLNGVPLGGDGTFAVTTIAQVPDPIGPGRRGTGTSTMVGPARGTQGE